ncbi:MAG TPA: hypothetical protein VFT30_01640 [Nitrospira sp.]|nr:hypothetical protein [Nitrospira sp.]
MAVSKTYVADLCRRHQYRNLKARRKWKHHVPRPDPAQSDLGPRPLTKNEKGQPSVVLTILDHASHAYLRL